jgi:translocation and assembly module TamB
LRLDQLGDFDRILGVSIRGSLAGSAAFTPASGRTRAQFQLDGRDLSMGQLAGSLHLAGEGPANAVALQLSAHAPNFGGSPARISSSALLDLDARELHLSSATAEYRGEKMRLASPARVSFASGVAVDRLRLGVRDSVLQFSGELLPALDLHASLKLTPQLVNVFMPDLLAEGTIEGRLDLQGTIAAPTGTVGLDAVGLRAASDEAAGLPVLDLHARAELDGRSATIDSRLTTGGASLLTV